MNNPPDLPRPIRQMLVLAALREAFDCTWVAIEEHLAEDPPARHRDLAVRWEEVCDHEFLALRSALPRTWPEAWETMRPPPPKLNAANLRRFYSDNLRGFDDWLRDWLSRA